MGKTKVLFLEDVGRHGRAGEVREVANGYARNYLLPRSMAVPATNDQLQRIEKIRKAAEGRRVREQQDMQSLAELLEGTRVEFSMRASSSGRLFGSVTNIHIADKLSEMLGVEIDRRTISLGDPIREPGSFDIEIRLPQQMSATVTVVVEGAGPGAAKAAAAIDEESPTIDEAIAQVEEEEAALADIEAESADETASSEADEADAVDEAPTEAVQADDEDEAETGKE
ncbi:MAG: large subunit ribosomal protein L9 [Chloroflexi bacterium]|jgi:large subunit ribosomal protein L9|nr:MAG: large subunit ribosomal protein L9 [Chloroflexota bacterium]